jgi:NAD(P)-dependent dehydrogenase (short-subunit alcohol dehydrogenase family)
MKYELDDSFSYYAKTKYFFGKNVIITGATGGIGSLLLTTLIKLGAKVFALVKDTNDFYKMLKKQNISSNLVEKMDFQFDSEYREVFSNIMKKLGGKLDILFICHGSFENGDLIGTDFKEFDTLMNINTRSVLALMSLASPFLKYTQGNIVVISSLESFIPVKGSFLNTVTKSMVNSIIKNSALELASFNVRVNGVAPGVTNTHFRYNRINGINDEFKEQMNQQFMERNGMNNLLSKKVIEPKDVVHTMLFLASSDAQFITGEIIQIDNGYSLNHDLCFSEDVTPGI